MKQPVNISPAPWSVSAGVVPNVGGRLIVQNCFGLPVCATSLRGVQGRVYEGERGTYSRSA